MDALAPLGHPAVVAAIVVAIVAVALVLSRRRRRRRATAPTPVPAPPPSPPEAAYLDSSHILEGPIVGDAAPADPPHDR